MFAFCIYDYKNQIVLLVRDRVGKKPLFYFLDNRRLLFASESKFFHVFPDLDLSLDPSSVSAYFHLQYVPEPHSIYSSVKKLEPGSILELDCRIWKSKKSTYWSLNDERSLSHRDDYIARLDISLKESIRYRLIADVEVGILLSGGIDSSLIAAYAAAEKANLRAFTATFERPDLDELSYAKKVAHSFGIDLITIKGDELTPKKFEDIVFHMDEPLGDPACVPTYLLCEALARHVTVVLSGEGADELFHGYSFYRYESLLPYIKPFAPFTKGVARKVVKEWEMRAAVPRSIVRLAKVLSESHDLGVSRWTTVFGEALLRSILEGGRIPFDPLYLQKIQDTIATLMDQVGEREARLLADVVQWLPADLLVKLDRMSMAHSVEARAPFLDQDVIKLALSLESRKKSDWWSGKKPLRLLLREKIPSQIRNTIAFRKKQGFETPVAEWLRSGLSEVVGDLLSAENLRRTGVLNVQIVQDLLRGINTIDNPVRLQRHLWQVLVFEAWAQQYRDGFGLTSRWKSLPLGAVPTSIHANSLRP